MKAKDLFAVSPFWSYWILSNLDSLKFWKNEMGKEGEFSRIFAAWHVAKMKTEKKPGLKYYLEIIMFDW